MSHIIDKTTKYIGQILALLSLALAFLITYDAFMRYIFSEGSIALQELEWHIFDIIFLFGLSYALKHKKHVRVDIFFVHFKKEDKAIIEILSILFY